MIHFITSNKGKFEEARQIVPELELLELDLSEEQEVDQQKIVEAKLQMASIEHDGALVVEDTGFYIECLPGLPGPLIKWFLKTIGRKGIYEICKKFDNFNARGVSIVGYMDENKNVQFFEGEVSGQVVLGRGDDGFGWDPVFVPEGFDETFAEMGREEKNEISMRRKAFEGLKDYLFIAENQE